jgi:hypothetical protein
MNEFEQYLLLYEIDPVRLSIEAHVRYLTVYNAKKGNPILPENAQKIKDAVLRLTGVPYVGSFVLIEELGPQFPPSRIKKIPGHHHHS